MNFKLDTSAGDRFQSVAEKAKLISNQRGVIVEFEFNGVICLVNPDTVLDWLYRDYCNAYTMEWKSVGPNCLSEYDDETKMSANDTAQQRWDKYIDDQLQKFTENGEPKFEVTFEKKITKAIK